MKKIIYFLFFITIHGYSQSIKAIYTRTIMKSIGSIKESISDFKPETYAYSYANKKSTYELIPIQKSSLDTSYIEHDGHKFETYKEITLPTTDITFKNLNNQLLQKEYTVSKKDFSAKEKLTDYEWTIQDETTIINGYTCKKATTKKSLAPITAWYCEEIPINDGPSVYWGLPGLILKVELGEYTTIVLNKIKISKENIEIEEPKTKSTPLPIREFYKSINDYLHSISSLTKYK